MSKIRDDHFNICGCGIPLVDSRSHDLVSACACPSLSQTGWILWVREISDHIMTSTTDVDYFKKYN